MRSGEPSGSPFLFARRQVYFRPFPVTFLYDWLRLGATWTDGGRSGVWHADERSSSMKKAVDEDMGIDAEEAASTVEEIKGYIRSNDFKKALEKATASRLKIVADLAPEMKGIRSEFIDYMADAAKSLDKDKKELKKKFGKAFKKLVDLRHYSGGYPKPESPAKLDVLADAVECALKYFDFMQIRDFRDRLEERGIFIDDSRTMTLEDDFPDINAGSWENLRDMVLEGAECQKKICDSTDEITVDVFENDIPEDVRFSKENPCGIKKGAFSKMVTAETMRRVKPEEKAEEYITNLSEASTFNISREELLREKFTEMLEAN